MQKQTYSINNLILNKDVLSIYINKFWDDIFNDIKDSKYLMIMVKVSFIESSEGIKSLAHMRSVNYDDKEAFYEYLVQRLGILSDSYTVIPINHLIFNYVVRNGKANESLEVRGFKESINTTINTHRFNNMQLPLSMDPKDYGTVQNQSEFSLNGEIVQRFTIVNQNKIYSIDKFLSSMVNKVTMLGGIDLSWTDTLLEEGIVKREIGKANIWYIDGQIICKQRIYNTKAFGTIKPEKVLKDNFVTMDIETIKDSDNQLIPYLISAYNGSKYINSYADLIIGGVYNQQELVTSFITQLSSFFGKGKTLTVYSHNLSGFDGIFLIKNLLNIGSVQPLIYNGKLISIRLILPNTKTIIFKDSLLLLPNSLRKLCVAFNVESHKSYFPFLLRNIFYKGIFPAYKYWSNISLPEYLNLRKEFKLLKIKWSFKDESIKYCNLDCKCLFDILIQFNNLIFSHFNQNIHSSLTLPSLAMRIYKSKFMPNLPNGIKIHQISGQVEKDIRQAYTGGAVDVYIPHNRKGSFLSRIFTKLYYYDVNSLYPFVMATLPMPIGLIKTFEGDIRRVNPNASGIFYCNITSPTNIKHPILQKRVEISEGVRTIAGIGSWTGWLNSNEYDNAIRNKYLVEIIRGHEFDTAVIFKEYVDTMFALRSQYDKNHPMNYIAKLLMNSLYGKFAMKSESTTVDIYNISTETRLTEFHDMLDKLGKTIQDFVLFKDSKNQDHAIVVRDNISKSINSEDDTYHGLDVNVAIASTITAGGRVWMSLIKNNPNFNLYYSDTDSAVTDAPLPDIMVGGGLGMFKLEHVIQRAVFLAPKVYGFITTEGEEIIKVKGVKQDALSTLKIQDLESLLMQDSSKEFSHEKWFKSITLGTIKVKDVAYMLKVTSNKRENIYIDGIFEATKPYHYSDIEDKNKK